MTDLFARRFSELITATYPTFLHNPGGSVWLKKTADEHLA